MLIGGIQTLTLLDYPEKVSCILFTAGCNFRCGFCHNPQFVDPEEVKGLAKNLIPEDKFFKFLDSRGKFLDGVVISGGEPTLQPDLIDFIRKIKDRDLLVKLDTNGTAPETLKTLLDEKLIDYVAMDVKTVMKDYSKLCETEVETDKIKQSIDLLQNSGIDYEFRTTVLKEFHNPEIIFKIAESIKGVPKYTIQNFRPQKVLNKAFEKFQGFTPPELEELKRSAEKVLKNVVVLD
ncbi:MAG: anaerobic ribonucleoside-triphosphate reductase activating protein [Candidatus Peregrinibacteria bacterium]|nr:anaerobic ribonucleoside-triphosphate reductase activating protein [Candidatus Peregrinibacteria bacterium]